MRLQCLAPQLIVLRVALGRAWTSETTPGEISTLKFRNTVANPHIVSTRSDTTSVAQFPDSESVTVVKIMTRTTEEEELKEELKGDACV